MKKSESRTPAQKKGDIGEDAALKRYIENGYTLVSRNYSKRCGEIDLIIKNGECIVFSEVKTRSERAIERPVTAINSKKVGSIVKTAMMFLSENDIPLQPRFDTVEVISDGKNILMLEITENAFDVSEFSSVF